jgi:hypothetical protein
MYVFTFVDGWMVVNTGQANVLIRAEIFAKITAILKSW